MNEVDFAAIGRAAVERSYKNFPDEPKGYWFDGRLDFPTANEEWLSRSGKVCKGLSNEGRVLILRRKMVKRVVGWTFRSLGRPPKKGELYCMNNSQSAEDFRRRHSSYDSDYTGCVAYSEEPLVEEVPEPTE